MFQSCSKRYVSPAGAHIFSSSGKVARVAVSHIQLSRETTCKGTHPTAFGREKERKPIALQLHGM